jgi:hypothetical protein
MQYVRKIKAAGSVFDKNCHDSEVDNPNRCAIANAEKGIPESNHLTGTGKPLPRPKYQRFVKSQNDVLRIPKVRIQIHTY